MSQKSKCPHCEHIINYLTVKEQGTDYERNYVTRYGSSNLDGEDIEINDSDVNDSDITDQETEETIYYCPECEEELCPDDLEILDDEKDKKLKTSPPKPDPIRTQEAAQQELVRHDLMRFSHGDIKFFICQTCDTKVEAHVAYVNNPKDAHEENEVECTKCGAIITDKTAKDIIVH